MDIYNTKPRKIKCVRNDDNVWGGGGENHHLLEVGKEYTLEDIIVHSWHTIVYIEEFPDMEFNSVVFEEIDQENNTMICEKCNCKDDCGWYASYKKIVDALQSSKQTRFLGITFWKQVLSLIPEEFLFLVRG